jgi:hypothetical protein
MPAQSNVDFSAFNNYCKATGNQRAVVDNNRNAYGVNCVDPRGVHRPLSVLDLCRRLFPRTNSLDVFQTFNRNPLRTWSCYGNLSEFGAPNFSGYATAVLGFPGANLFGSTAYDWWVTDFAGNRIRQLTIRELWEACDWTFDRLTVARVSHFFGEQVINGRSRVWRCWG